MENALVLAAIPALLFALVNYIDKFLIVKYIKGGNVGSLVVFSALAGIAFVILAPIFDPGVLGVNPSIALLLIAGGVLVGLAYLTYFYALESGEDTMSVVAQFLMIPVFGGILGYFIFDEFLGASQMAGAMLVIIGSVFLSWNEEMGRSLKINWKQLILMLVSSLLFALNAVIFKIGGIEDNFWVAVFYENLGLLLLGVFFILFIKAYSVEFFRILRLN